MSLPDTARTSADVSKALPPAGRGHAGRAITPQPELLEALVEFAAAAGHEINNPLAVILGRVQLLHSREADPARRQALETIAGQAHRIRDMIGDLMVFADPPPPQLSRVELVTTLAPLLNHLRQSTPEPVRPGRPVIPPALLQDDLPANLWVRADPDHLRTAVAELLRNALHPTVAASRVELRAELVGETAESPQSAGKSESPSYCRLIVRDDGRGLSAEESVHLFNPFYSGRQAGRGLGFGLCKAWRLATQQGARLRVISHGSATTCPPPANSPLDATPFRTEFHLDWPLDTETT